MIRRTLRAKDLAIETEYSNWQLFARLRELPVVDQTDFVRKLVGSFAKGHWTVPQAAWAAKIVGDHEAEHPPQPLERIAGFGGIVKFMMRSTQKWSTITVICKCYRLSMPLGMDILPVQISRAGNKYPGCWNVSNGRRFRDPKNQWYGRLWPNGEFERHPECPDCLLAELHQFAFDPMAYLAERGRCEGRCCFCGATLDSASGISQILGRGQRCSEKHGLPWGKAEAKQIATVLGIEWP